MFWEASIIGGAPESVVNTLTVAKLDWLKDQTDCLNIWVNKSYYLTDGELLLAWANLGALIDIIDSRCHTQINPLSVKMFTKRNK